MQGMSAPLARTEQLVTTQSGDDVLVYDQQNHHMHHLNSASAAVWNLCDGRTTLSEIMVKTGMTEDTLRIALTKLESAGLLNGGLAPEMRQKVQSRRALMKKAAVAGSIPVIVSVTAPMAAHAGTPDPEPIQCDNCEDPDTCCPQGTCFLEVGVEGCIEVLGIEVIVGVCLAAVCP